MINNAIIKATELLNSNEYNINGYTDLNKILEENKFNLINVDFHNMKSMVGVVAALWCENENKDIFIQKTDINPRKRFAIAYELGHYYLGHYKNKKKNLIADRAIGYSNINLSDEQKEAKDFAMELLIPERDIIKRSAEYRYRFLSDLEDYFLVSNMAMRYRLDNLGIKYHS